MADFTEVVDSSLFDSRMLANAFPGSADTMTLTELLLLTRATKTKSLRVLDKLLSPVLRRFEHGSTIFTTEPERAAPPRTKGPRPPQRLPPAAGHRAHLTAASCVTRLCWGGPTGSDPKARPIQCMDGLQRAPPGQNVDPIEPPNLKAKPKFRSGRTCATPAPPSAPPLGPAGTIGSSARPSSSVSLSTDLSPAEVEGVATLLHSLAAVTAPTRQPSELRILCGPWAALSTDVSPAEVL